MINYPSKIKNKILNAKNLLKKIKKVRHNKKVALCHGTFDIVHPGHIRHLVYAKEKSDILIVSVTSDKFVVKSADVPYIPEELRARNLAFLEIVDFVTIDHHQKPLNLISQLKPDYFIKGFEYSTNKIHPNTKEEIQLLKKFNGQILFSPADVVYSSSAIKKNYKPKIAKEKIMSIMDSENVNFNKLFKVLDRYKNIRVHVVGDTIVDKYNYCTILGQTTKTPTFSVKKISDEIFLGGAAIVAKHLSRLGAKVSFTTLIGSDYLSKFVKKDLDKSGIKLNPILDKNRNTTLKERYWADKYKLLQVNTVDNQIPTREIISKISESIRKIKADIIIFSDFRHGVFNKLSINTYSKNIKKGILKVADSQVSNRWGNISEFKNFDLILPNEKEARFSLGDQDSPVRNLGTKLLNVSKSKNLILKLEDKGIMVFRKKGLYPREFFPIDTFADKLIDGIGAGDAMLAAASLGLYVSKNILISSILGNLSASIACEQTGNIPISINDLKDKLKKLQDTFNY